MEWEGLGSFPPKRVAGKSTVKQMRYFFHGMRQPLPDGRGSVFRRWRYPPDWRPSKTPVVPMRPLPLAH
jgi:hypothetical protein